MALLCLFAVVMCELFPRLQSRRMKRGIAYEVQRTGQSQDANITAAVPDDQLLKCEEVETKTSFVIWANDKPFWDYAFAELNRDTDDLELFPVNCKAYSPPPTRPSYTFDPTLQSLLSTMGVPMVTFNHEVHCDPCVVVSFNMTCLEKCVAPRKGQQFLKVHKEVMKVGGSCGVRRKSVKERPLQACMMSSKTNEFASCKVRA